MKSDSSQALLDEIKAINKKLSRLDKIEERVEEILVDKNRNALEIKAIRATTNALDRNIDILKLDLENVKNETKGLKEKLKNIEQYAKDTHQLATDIAGHAVTQEEFRHLEKRVVTLENN